MKMCKMSSEELEKVSGDEEAEGREGEKEGEEVPHETECIHELPG